MKPFFVSILVFLGLFLAGCTTVQIGGQAVPKDAVSVDLSGRHITSTEKIALLTELRSVDLRDNPLELEDIDALRAALPDCLIRWSIPLDGYAFDSSSSAIQDPAFSAASIPILSRFSNLTSVDATGSTAYAALLEATQRYPDCTFLWRVPVGKQTFISTEETITLSDPVDAETLVNACRALPAVKSIDVSALSLSPDEISQLVAACPEIRFVAAIPIGKKTYASTADSWDLTGSTPVSFEALSAALACSSALKTVVWEDCPLRDAEKLRLIADYPDISFLWPVQLLRDVTVSSDITDLILTGHTVNDLDSLITKFKLLPNLNTVEMCNCGPSDAEMAAFRYRLPHLKVVWMVRVGDWEMRTDTIAFSMGNTSEFPGGRFLGRICARYRNFTDETMIPLQYCTDLIALDVGHSYGLDDISIVYKLPKLRYLVIGRTAVTDLTPIGSLSGLEYLEVFSLHITDITPLANCKKLQYLNVSNNRFTDIETLSQLSALKRLWMIGCGTVPDAEVEKLRAILPDCIIMEKGKHPTDKQWRVKNEGYIKMQGLFNLFAIQK